MKIKRKTRIHNYIIHVIKEILSYVLKYKNFSFFTLLFLFKKHTLLEIATLFTLIDYCIIA